MKTNKKNYKQFEVAHDTNKVHITMCVIIVKKAGVKLPSAELLNMARTANPDGCGFATSSGEYFRSTNFNRFMKAFTEKVKVEDDVVIHFRWATHGSVKAKNCHPFKGKYNGKKIFFAHNGVLPIESVNDMTDSEICFRDHILPLLEEEGGFTPFTDLYLNKERGTSRFAFIDEEGLHLYGDFVNYKGLLLSNTRFLGWRYYDELNAQRRKKLRNVYEGKFSGVGF